LDKKKKYVVIPGLIGKHFIGDGQLIKQFGVDPRECLSPSEIWSKGDKSWACHYKNYPKNYDDLIPLRPQKEGDYSLKKAKVDFVREKLIGATQAYYSWRNRKSLYQSSDINWSNT